MPTTTHPVTASIYCGSYQCGHIARSSDRAIKRALVLHLIREAGTTPDTRNENADTLAALALMASGRPCSEVRNYRTPGYTAATVPVTPATADPFGLSDECVEVMALVAQGYSHPEIATMTHRAKETVRSLVSVARKATSAHSQEAAAARLFVLGIIE